MNFFGENINWRNHVKHNCAHCNEWKAHWRSSLTELMSSVHRAPLERVAKPARPYSPKSAAHVEKCIWRWWASRSSLRLIAGRIDNSHIVRWYWGRGSSLIEFSGRMLLAMHFGHSVHANRETRGSTGLDQCRASSRRLPVCIALASISTESSHWRSSWCVRGHKDAFVASLWRLPRRSSDVNSHSVGGQQLLDRHPIFRYQNVHPSVWLV